MQNTVIYWQVKGEMRLSVMDYVVADVIRQHSKKTGWCELTKKDIGGICGVPLRGIFLILSRLEERGFVERVRGEDIRDSKVKTTDAYNAFFPTEDGGEKPPDVTDAGTLGPAGPSMEALKLAAESTAEPVPEISAGEKKKRQTIQPMVSEINLYAEKLHKSPIMVETLRPDEWYNLRKVCDAIGEKRYVKSALEKLYQLGAIGGGGGWWFKGMAKEIELVMGFCRQEEIVMEKYIEKETRHARPDTGGVPGIRDDGQQDGV
jgi:hypothetical protein